MIGNPYDKKDRRKRRSHRLASSRAAGDTGRQTLAPPPLLLPPLLVAPPPESRSGWPRGPDEGVGAAFFPFHQAPRRARPSGARWSTPATEVPPAVAVRNQMLVSLRGGGGELGNLKT
jgi:hypothetical protein